MRSPNSFTIPGDVYQTFKKEITLILHNLFLKIEQEGTFPNSLYEDSFNLIAKYRTRKENYGSIQLTNIDGKNLKIISKSNQAAYIKNHHDQLNLFQIHKVGSTFENQPVINHFNRLKKKNIN